MLLFFATKKKHLFSSIIDFNPLKRYTIYVQVCVKILRFYEENMLMRRIINTFKYGARKVKRTLALALCAGVVAVAFAVLALVLSNLLCFFVAIVGTFVTISLVQTFMIAEGENPTVPKSSGDTGTKEPPTEVNNIAPQFEHIHEENVVKTKEPKKEKVKKKITKKNRTKKEKTRKEKVRKQKSKEQNVQETDTFVPEQIHTQELKLNDYVPEQVYAQEPVEYGLEHSSSLTEEYSKAKVDSAEEYLEPTLDSSEDYSDNDKASKKKFKVITAETAASYTKKKIRKTLHKYKVIKDHRMVIVDRSDRYHIYQTPAFIWVQDNQFHILLIEEEPRLLMVPLFRVTEITYLKKQPVDMEKDYKLFEKSTILTDSFKPYLPDYNHSNKTSDLTVYKNLYGITQGIYFTNNSAKNLFDLLGVEFHVEDKVTTSNKVNIFFKEVYKSNIKLRDNILDANGYADSITRILDDMAHSSISHAEFKDTLNLMIRNKLITDEYASHYMDVRNSFNG